MKIRWLAESFAKPMNPWVLEFGGRSANGATEAVDRANFTMLVVNPKSVPAPVEAAAGSSCDTAGSAAIAIANRYPKTRRDAVPAIPKSLLPNRLLDVEVNRSRTDLGGF